MQFSGESEKHFNQSHVTAIKGGAGRLLAETFASSEDHVHTYPPPPQPERLDRQNLQVDGMTTPNEKFYEQKVR